MKDDLLTNRTIGAAIEVHLLLSGLERALLFNFNSVPLKSGIRRLNKTNPSPVSPVSEPFPFPADGGPSMRDEAN